MLEDCEDGEKTRAHSEQTYCKENRVPYLASSSKVETQSWKWVCKNIVSRYVREKMNVSTQQVLLLFIETYFCFQNVSKGTEFNIGF